MKLRRKLGILALAAIASASLAITMSGTASAAAPGQLLVTGPCGDILRFTERKAPTIVLTITIPSTDPSEVWTLTAQQQEYGPVTGARIGNPIDLVPNPLPPLAFSPAEGGFSTTANFTDTPGATLGISYVATKTAPTTETCVNQGFITDPGGGNPGPAPENPVGKPDSAPVLTGATEADRGTHVVSLQFDQEMLTAAGGIPTITRFAVTVNGVNRNVAAVSVTDDSPPNKAVLSLTLAGTVLARNAVVTVLYRQPLNTTDPQLQDLDGNVVSGFGPVSVTAF